MPLTGTGWSSFGLIVGAFTPIDGAAPEVAYRAVFGFLAGVLTIVVVVYARVEDVHPSSERTSPDRLP